MSPKVSTSTAENDRLSSGCHKRFGDYVLNVGSDHYAICETHKTYFYASSNLLDGSAFLVHQSVVEQFSKTRPLLREEKPRAA